jgi:hypothetical protein
MFRYPFRNEFAMEEQTATNQCPKGGVDVRNVLTTLYKWHPGAERAAQADAGRLQVVDATILLG